MGSDFWWRSGSGRKRNLVNPVGAEPPRKDPHDLRPGDTVYWDDVGDATSKGTVVAFSEEEYVQVLRADPVALTRIALVPFDALRTTPDGPRRRVRNEMSRGGGF